MVTTVIWQSTSAFPAAIRPRRRDGLSLFGVMLITLTIARLVLRSGSYATITGKAFRPREMDVGGMRWPLLGIAWGYIVRRGDPAAGGAAADTSFERFATVILPQMHFTLANYQTALPMGLGGGPAFVNSLMLGVSVATIGVVVIGVLAWIIYRSRMPGRGAARIRHDVSAGGAAPGIRARPALGDGSTLADPDLRHALAAGIAYFTVFLPLGLRTIAGVVLQVDPSLEECARVCGASWVYRCAP